MQRARKDCLQMFAYVEFCYGEMSYSCSNGACSCRLQWIELCTELGATYFYPEFVTRVYAYFSQNKHVNALTSNIKWGIFFLDNFSQAFFFRRIKIWSGSVKQVVKLLVCSDIFLLLSHEIEIEEGRVVGGRGWVWKTNIWICLVLSHF